MNESVFRRLCMTSVCGAILIPAILVLVSPGPGDDIATAADAAAAVVASAAATGGGSPGTAPAGRDAARSPALDRTTR